MLYQKLLAVFIVLVITISLFWLVFDSAGSALTKRKIKAYQHGQMCRNNNVPANANPYRDEFQRIRWLDGWIEGDKD